MVQNGWHIGDQQEKKTFSAELAHIVHSLQYSHRNLKDLLNCAYGRHDRDQISKDSVAVPFTQ